MSSRQSKMDCSVGWLETKGMVFKAFGQERFSCCLLPIASGLFSRSATKSAAATSAATWFS